MIEPDDVGTVWFAGLVEDQDDPEEEMLLLAATEKGVTPSEYNITVSEDGDISVSSP